EPSIKEDDAEGKPVFWTLTDLMHSIKSFTSHKIQDLEGSAGVWEKEWHDRIIRSEEDLAEKFNYVMRNPWDAGEAKPNEDYEWVWYAEEELVGSIGGSR